ncbi:hypothetical protein [Bradyrhizobium sp. NP1]|uniref:hypothetical protein n=1 Tax=Bradyrhizobium sp. NP1 TaxID=3049772 RepID=UPI0025A59844|nr:hypothetical protein [Bradyrhizobium sp. NP1]WJR81151.1 hypothetical protein QOU61_15760 [Bradyrhizobium sp. NP1]
MTMFWSAQFRRTIAGRLAVISASAAIAISFPAAAAIKDRRHAVTVYAGEAIVLDGHAQADQGCNPKAPPTFRLDMAPQHGVVCTRINQIKVEEAYAGDDACYGRMISGIEIIYLPQQDYVGPDQLRFESMGPPASFNVEFDLTIVRALPGAAALEPLDINVVPAEAMKPGGPVPSCTEPVS